VNKIVEWFARSREALSQPEVIERLAKIEQAIELQYVGKPQAEIDNSLATAVAELIQSLRETTAAAIQIGSLLIIKLPNEREGSKILVRHLTADELMVLHKDPELLATPADILRSMRQRLGGGVAAGAEENVP